MRIFIAPEGVWQQSAPLSANALELRGFYKIVKDFGLSFRYRCEASRADRRRT
jgi:hypothetical protein